MGVTKQLQTRSSSWLYLKKRREEKRREEKRREEGLSLARALTIALCLSGANIAQVSAAHPGDGAVVVEEEGGAAVRCLAIRHEVVEITKTHIRGGHDPVRTGDTAAAALPIKNIMNFTPNLESVLESVFAVSEWKDAKAAETVKEAEAEKAKAVAKAVAEAVAEAETVLSRAKLAKAVVHAKALEDRGEDVFAIEAADRAVVDAIAAALRNGLLQEEVDRVVAEARKGAFAEEADEAVAREGAVARAAAVVNGLPRPWLDAFRNLVAADAAFEEIRFSNSLLAEKLRPIFAKIDVEAGMLGLEYASPHRKNLIEHY